MNKRAKLAMIVCFLTAAVYFVQSGSATGGRESAQPNLRAVGLRPVRAPEIPLPGHFQTPCADALDHSLPLPSSIDKNQFVAYEKQVLSFLQSGAYKTNLKWCGDKGVRDTGPFLREVLSQARMSISPLQIYL